MPHSLKYLVIAGMIMVAIAGMILSQRYDFKGGDLQGRLVPSCKGLGQSCSHANMNRYDRSGQGDCCSGFVCAGGGYDPSTIQKTCRRR